MTSFIPTHRRLISGLVAVTVVVTANLLAAEAETAGAEDAASDGMAGAAAVEYELTPAPAPITGITGPELSELPDLEEPGFVVPVLSRPKLELPPLPKVDVASIRAEAATWLGDGVMSAPTGRIEVAAPDVAESDALDAPTIDVPALERPVLAPPPVR